MGLQHSETAESRIHGIKHERSQALIDFAFRFAASIHSDHKRKYTGEPYIVHPIAVARLVASVTTDCEMISAAFLHDVIEDSHIEFKDLVDVGFGSGIASLVRQLSDVSKPTDGVRAVRKAIDRQYLTGASDRAKTIKLADMIDNTKSIVEHDLSFAKVYMREKRLLLPGLYGGDNHLMDQAAAFVGDFFRANPE